MSLSPLHNAIGMVHAAVIANGRAERLSTLISELLPPQASVLDVGCGDGLVASLVMKKRPDVRISGIDVCKRKTPLIPVEVFDGATIPYDDHFFDAVTIIDVLHHTDDPTSVLLEAARVSKSVVIVKDHLADDLISRLTLRFMDWGGNAPHGVRLPYNYLSSAEWKTATNAAGLQSERYIGQLSLYPKWLSWAFDRRLHFIDRFRVTS